MSQNSASPGRVSFESRAFVSLESRRWREGPRGQQARGEESSILFRFQVWVVRASMRRGLLHQVSEACPSPPSRVLTVVLGHVSGPCLFSSALTSPLPCLVAEVVDMMPCWSWAPPGSQEAGPAALTPGHCRNTSFGPFAPAALPAPLCCLASTVRAGWRAAPQVLRGLVE